MHLLLVSHNIKAALPEYRPNSHKYWRRGKNVACSGIWVRGQDKRGGKASLNPATIEKTLGPEKEVEVAKETAASPPVATSLGFIVQKGKTQHVILTLYFFSWAPFVCRGNIHSALWKVYKLKMGTAQWCVVREWFTMPRNTTMMGHLRFFGLNACLSTCSTLILVLADGNEKYAFEIFWSCVCLHKKWADLPACVLTNTCRKS